MGFCRWAGQRVYQSPLHIDKLSAALLMIVARIMLVKEGVEADVGDGDVGKGTRVGCWL